MTQTEVQNRLYWLKNEYNFDVYYQIKIFRHSYVLENKVNYHSVVDDKNHFTGFTNVVVVDWDDATKFRIYTYYTRDKDKSCAPLWSKKYVEAKDVKFWLKQFYSSCRYIRYDLDHIESTAWLEEQEVYKKQYERLKKIAESGDYTYYDGSTEES